MDDDPFALPTTAAVSDRVSIIRGGRYRLPQLDGTHKPGGYQRVSNLVSAYSDQFGLRLWELGEVLQGVAMSHDLFQALLLADLPGMDKPTRRAWVEQFIEHAKEASGGNAAAKHGTERHAAVETHHAGLPLGHLNPHTRRAVGLYASALQRHRLRALPGMQERRVLVESLEVVGTLDNVLADHLGDLYVGDLKTQRRFWTWLEIGAQLACYAHGDAMWDATVGRWVDMPPVSLERALVLWMPRETDDGEPRVDVYTVDIEAGWETARTAYMVVQDRAAAKSVRNPRAWLRPAPPVTATERYAARFLAVETLAEGRALVEEAKAAGVWSWELRDCAQLAHDRLALPA